MLRIGKAKPLSRKKGWKNRNVVIMACCCVCEMVEMKRPAPSEVIRNRIAQKNSSSALPRNGTWKNRRAATTTSDRVDQAHQGERQRFAEHQLDGADGRHHQLLHGSDFFFAHDGHGGEHQGDQHDDIDDDARDKIIAAEQVRD